MPASRIDIRWLRYSRMALTAILMAACILLWDVAQGLEVAVALLVAYLTAHAAYVRWRHASNAGSAVLLAAWAWLALLAVAFLWASSRGSYSLEWPHLQSDMNGYFCWAVHHHNGCVPEPKMMFTGWPRAIVALWTLLGQSLVWPVALNVALTLMALVLTARLAAALWQGRTSTRRSSVATWAMALTAVLGFWMAEGALLLKEPSVYVAVLLAALAMARLLTPDAGRPRLAPALLLFAAGAFILAAVRAKYVNFLFFGALLVWCADFRRNAKPAAALLLITALCWWLGMEMGSHYTVTVQLKNITSSQEMGQAMDGTQGAAALFPDYYRYPEWKRVLMLPVSCAVQCIIPLPWLPSWSSLTLLNIAPRLQLGWYLVAAMAMWFYVRHWRRLDRQLRCWALFAPVCFILIAYMTGGRVSRYILPFQPLITALIAVVPARKFLKP